MKKRLCLVVVAIYIFSHVIMPTNAATLNSVKKESVLTSITPAIVVAILFVKFDVFDISIEF